MAKYQLNINGQNKEVTVDPSTPLLWVLREDLKMGHEIRLRCQRVRAVRAACRRGDPLLHGPGIDDRGTTLVTIEAWAGSGRPRCAGRLGVGRRRRVWLLPERTNHECGCPSQTHAQTTTPH